MTGLYIGLIVDLLYIVMLRLTVLIEWEPTVWLQRLSLTKVIANTKLQHQWRRNCYANPRNQIIIQIKSNCLIESPYFDHLQL